MKVGDRRIKGIKDHRIRGFQGAEDSRIKGAKDQRVSGSRGFKDQRSKGSKGFREQKIQGSKGFGGSEESRIIGLKGRDGRRKFLARPPSAIWLWVFSLCSFDPLLLESFELQVKHL
jgi:hypothetical protein